MSETTENKKKKQSKNGTPESAWWPVIEEGVRLYVTPRTRYIYDRGGLTLPEGPALYVSNHPSQMDYYAVTQLISPKRLLAIANEYFMRKGIAKKLLSSIGAIPKKLFTDESGVILKARRAVKAGHSIYLAPEGRMSVTGEPYPIIASTGAFARFLNVPLVTVRISGGYLNKPKWRPFYLKQKVLVKLVRVVPPETLKAMTPEEVNALICEDIRNDDFAFAASEGLRYRSRRKAEGLTGLIYRCPACGSLYRLREEGNALVCPDCGLKLEFGEDYHFKENAGGWRTVADVYHALEARERDEQPELCCEVTVRRFEGETEVSGEGVCRFGREGFSFEGTVDGEAVSFRRPLEELTALPFSCSEEFETYFENRLYYFYPKEDRCQCARWGLLADLMCGRLYEKE